MEFKTKDFARAANDLSSFYEGVKFVAQKIKQLFTPKHSTQELSSFKQDRFYRDNKQHFQKYADKTDLVKLASDCGYELDKDISTRKCAVMHRKGEDGRDETILITRDEKGKFQFVNAHDRKDSGDTLAFIAKQSLDPVQAFDVLRKYLERPIDKQSLLTGNKLDSKQIVGEYVKRMELDFKPSIGKVPGYQQMKPEAKAELLGSLKQAQNGPCDELTKSALEKIDLIGYAKKNGFELREDLSNSKGAVMVNPLNTRDVIVISKDEQGRFMYQGAEGEKGNIIDFDRNRAFGLKNNLTEQLKQHNVENRVAEHSMKKPGELISFQDSKRESIVSGIKPLEHSFELAKGKVDEKGIKTMLDTAIKAICPVPNKAKDLAEGLTQGQGKSNGKAAEVKNSNGHGFGLGA